MYFYKKGNNYLKTKHPVEGYEEITEEEYNNREIRKHNVAEIVKLKKQLAATDYQAIKYAEGYYTEEEYAPIKAYREGLREQIRALENK